MENESEIVSKQIPEKKAKRKYTRRQPVQSEPIPAPIVNAPVTPQPPSPHILALEERILALSDKRSQLQQLISAASQKVNAAQQDLRYVQEAFAGVNEEIQFKMGLIAQMRGGPAPPAPQYQPAQFAPRPQTWPPQSPNYTPAAPYPQDPPPFQQREMTQPTDMGFASYPATDRNRGLYPDVVGGFDGVRTESAGDVLADMRSSGY